MGLTKIIFFIAAPITGMTVAAFSLKKQLPKACRWFGNYIGLSYVFFKSMIKIMKPQDHMTYEMIDIARKASQQSQTLRRELRNTVKKVKEEIKEKRDQTFKDFENQFPILKDELQQIQKATQLSNTPMANASINSAKQSANLTLIMMQLKKKQLLNKKLLKKQSQKFHQDL